MHDTTYLAITY